MADIVGGLFGVTPQSLMQQQQQNINAEANAYAQLDPFQRATAGFYKAGAQIPGAVAGMMGVQDPQLAAASTAQKLASQFDIGTAEGLQGLSRALLQAGQQTGNPLLANFAAMTNDKARGLAAEQVKLGLTTSQTVENYAKAAKDRAEASRVPGADKLVGLSTPASAAAYATSGNIGDLVLADKGTPENQADQILLNSYIAQAGGDRTVGAQAFANYKQNFAINKAIAGKAIQTVDLGGLTSLFAKKEAEESAKDITETLKKAGEQLSTGSKLSRDINELEKILPNMFTGKFAGLSTEASKTLSAIGVPISPKASNTEVAKAIMNNFVLPAVKQLPGSLAAKELAFLQQTKPDVIQEPATIQRLMNMVKDDIAVNKLVVKRAEQYKQANSLKTLKDFNLPLEQSQIYDNLIKFNNIKAKALAKRGITQQEADFASQFEKMLGE